MAKVQDLPTSVTQEQLDELGRTLQGLITNAETLQF
jgi:hypothetical protein